jgi:hypothetical protein
MSEQPQVSTLTDDEIFTRRVDGKQVWEAPRLSELRIGVSAGGAIREAEDDGFDDAASGPS